VEIKTKFSKPRIFLVDAADQYLTTVQQMWEKGGENYQFTNQIKE